jgi:hypothetical protein
MHLCMQIWAVNEFEGVTDFTSKFCMLQQALYRGRLINSDSVAFGVQGNLSGLRVRELKIMGNYCSQAKTGFSALNQTYRETLKL